MALVVIVGMKEGKVAYEHIYWDRAGLLIQLGLLDPAELPVDSHTAGRLLAFTGKGRAPAGPPLRNDRCGGTPPASEPAIFT